MYFLVILDPVHLLIQPNLLAFESGAEGVEVCPAGARQRDTQVLKVFGATYCPTATWYPVPAIYSLGEQQPADLAAG